MPLTDTACKNAKPTDKARKMADGHGLYLEVMPSGARYWRLKYRFMEKEKRLALGVYPDVTLGQARQKGEGARKLLANGVDPSFAKKEQKRQATLDAENTLRLSPANGTKKTSSVGLTGMERPSSTDWKSIFFR